jgi:hypothetical protein
MDDKTKVVLAASAATIGFLAVKLYRSNKRYRNLSKKARQLVHWSELAQRIMLETWEQHPEMLAKYSDALATDVEFFAIIQQEDL